MSNSGGKLLILLLLTINLFTFAVSEYVWIVTCLGPDRLLIVQMEGTWLSVLCWIELSLLSGVGVDNNGILVLGATNLPWSLDHAIRRRLVSYCMCNQVCLPNGAELWQWKIWQIEHLQKLILMNKPLTNWYIVGNILREKGWWDRLSSDLLDFSLVKVLRYVVQKSTMSMHITPNWIFINISCFKRGNFIL